MEYVRTERVVGRRPQFIRYRHLLDRYVREHERTRIGTIRRGHKEP